MIASSQLPQACSVAYMLLFYRQQSGQVTQLHTQLKIYLQFCSDRGLLITEQSVLIFNQQRPSRPFMHFSRFITLYKQIGRPLVLSNKQLSEMPRLGDYLLSELMQYWYWPPWRTKADEIGQGRGLLTWWSYLCQVDNGTLPLIDLIDGYLRHEHDRGVSAELIKQRLVVLRWWARWVLERATLLRLDQPVQQQLRLISKLTISENPWIINQCAKWNYASPIAKALHIEKVAHLLASLLDEGIALYKLRVIRVRHIHLRYIELSTIELDDGQSWTLSHNACRRLRVYLETTDRLEWALFRRNDYLFAEVDWDTLWALSRHYLRQYREGRQRNKAYNRNFSNRIRPLSSIGSVIS